MRALRVGITGKMGSGKSTLSRFLRQKRIEVLESDVMAKEIMAHDAHVRGEISALLGPEAYHHHELNRPFVAQTIFSDKSKRIALESIVHPRVTAAMNLLFANAEPGQAIALESALVLQTELWKEFDYIILVSATDEVVIERLAQQGKFSADDIQARLREQASAKFATEEIDFTIENNGSLEDFEKNCQLILTLLPALAKRDLPEVPLHQVDLDIGEEESENGVM